MKQKSSLIIVAHGSRREASNQEIEELTERVQEKIGSRFFHVRCAFLELAKPDIPTAIEADIGLGAEMITILPFFLSAGTHIATDIPGIIQQKQRDHPHIKLQMAPYVGGLDGMVSLVISAVEMGDANQ